MEPLKRDWVLASPTAPSALELAQQTRIVAEDETWVALVPFWAVWPFELLLLPKQPVARIEALTNPQREGLADLLKQVTTAYNRVFDKPFPYSMGLHPAPPTASPIPNGSSTSTSIRPSCAPPPSENSWSASNSSALPNATSPQNPQPATSAALSPKLRVFKKHSDPTFG